MARLTKKQKEASSKVEANRTYYVSESSALIKEISNANFDADRKSVV